VVEVPFTSRLAAEPGLDAGELLESAVTPRAKAIYVTTPNNPDGAVLTREQLASVARVAIENDLWVFSDEVYAEVTYGAPHVSIASLPGMAERTVVVQSLSKSHALAGARIGAVIAPEPVVAAARRVGVHTVFNVPVAMQRAAALAMSGGDAWMRAALIDYRAARDEAAAALAGSGLRFATAQGATYLFLDFEAVLGGRPLSVALERAIDHGVLLTPGEAFGRGYERFARLCFTAVPRPRLAEGCARLRAAVESLASR
jgi:aspartate/methionine/tyrosine aminotransferase